MTEKEKPKYSADPYFDLPPILPNEIRGDIECPYCHEPLMLKLDAARYLLYQCLTAWCPNQAGFNMRMFFRRKTEPDRLYTGYCGG
jgi:hypothetical protein